MASEPSYNCRIPTPNTPMVDPNTGMISPAWFRWATAMMTRTGDSEGIGTATVEASATAAQTTANTAQSTANAAQIAATGAQATATAAGTATATETTARIAAVTSEATTRANADTAEATARAAAVTAETNARIAADALLAPKASPAFTGSVTTTGGVGVWGHAVPGAQPAAPVTLADVIAIIRGCGLSA